MHKHKKKKKKNEIVSIKKKLNVLTKTTKYEKKRKEKVHEFI